MSGPISGAFQQASQWVSGKLPWSNQNTQPKQDTGPGNAMANSGNGQPMPLNSGGYGNFPQGQKTQGQVNPYNRMSATPAGFPQQQAALAKGIPSLPQALPRDVMEKRLPVKALPKRPKFSLTPDQIRFNPNLMETLKFQEEFISMPWNFSNHIDPFSHH